MALVERLLAIDDTKLPIHGLVAAIGEWRRGQVTRAQASAALGLDASDEAELQLIFNTGITREELKDVFYLAEIGIAYTTPAAMRARLGI